MVPPLGDQFLTGDLLKSRNAAWTDEEAFRLVLTPSCDLVTRSGLERRAQRMLVACCERLKKLGKIKLSPGRKLSAEDKKNLRPILAEGMAGYRIPIPEFHGHVPLMAANLQRLELLEWQQVDSELVDSCPPGEGGFERVASTDSPFREMVVWAYLRVTGRPGLPQIDVEDWLKNISDHLEERD